MGRDYFPRVFIGCFERAGWLLQRHQVCNNAQDCLLPKAHEILQSPALGFLLLTMHKAGRCFEEERITCWRIDERIKMNMQASLCTFSSADLMGKKNPQA